jgi:hypothetical protein
VDPFVQSRWRDDEDGRRHFSCLCRFRPIPYVMCVWNLCSRSIVDRVCLVVKEWLKYTGLCSRFSSLIESVDFLLFLEILENGEAEWKNERTKGRKAIDEKRKKEGTTVSIYCPVWWREKVVQRDVYSCSLHRPVGSIQASPSPSSCPFTKERGKDLLGDLLSHTGTLWSYVERNMCVFPSLF